jgi:hypothetical protein
MLRRATRIFALMVGLATIGLATSAFAQDEPLEVNVKTFYDQPLPVTITSGTLRNFGFTSHLEAIVGLNKDNNVKIESASFFLLTFHGDKGVAGEGWTETNPGGLMIHSTTLALRPGDKAYLIVNKVVTSTRTFSLDMTDVVANIRRTIAGESFTAPSIQISMLLPPDGTLKRVQDTSCLAAAAATATQVCGSGQVASVSCSVSSGTVSFACKGGATTTKPPGGSS